jgi:hypothetical protein
MVLFTKFIKNTWKQEENKTLVKRVSELETAKATTANRGNKNKLDDLQENVVKLTASNRELQLKLTDILNRNAQLETLNARTMLQNKNLAELTKKSNAKLTEPMEVDSESKPSETLAASKTKEAVAVVNKLKKKKKCRYYERGQCLKEKSCQFFHPANVCVLFSRLGEGTCPDGNFCEKSHPSQICEEWLEGGCVKENKCKMQHPGKTGPETNNYSEKRGSGSGYQNKRRGSQSHKSFQAQSQQNDFKPNYIQHQGYDQSRIQQNAPQMVPNPNLFQVPPPQPLSFGPPHGIRYTNYRYRPYNQSSFLCKGASHLDPGAISLSGLQALLQQQAGAGHQVFQHHQQGGRPRTGG